MHLETQRADSRPIPSISKFLDHAGETTQLTADLLDGKETARSVQKVSMWKARELIRNMTQKPLKPLWKSTGIRRVLPESGTHEAAEALHHLRESQLQQS